MSNIKSVPASFTIIWFLMAFNGLFTFVNTNELLVRLLGITACTCLFLKRKRLFFYLLVGVMVLLLPITIQDFGFISFMNLDFAMGVVCLAMLLIARNLGKVESRSDSTT